MRILPLRHVNSLRKRYHALPTSTSRDLPTHAFFYHSRTSPAIAHIFHSHLQLVHFSGHRAHFSPSSSTCAFHCSPRTFFAFIFNLRTSSHIARVFPTTRAPLRPSCAHLRCSSKPGTHCT